MRPWRLLSLCASDAARNMATDEAILRTYAEGQAPPTLRFYTWDPPAVSCGRFQDPSRVVDLAACAEWGFAVVRRPSGGRAVLHHGDLTYAVVSGKRDGLPHGVLPAYLYLSRGLLAGLALLGVPAALHAPGEREDAAPSPACFAAPSWHELIVGGRKVVGSAQRWQSNCLLQHGAIMLTFSPEESARVVRPRSAADSLAECLAQAAAGLSEFVPDLDPPRLATALTEGFAEALRIDLRQGELTGAERQLVEELRPKYTYVARP